MALPSERDNGVRWNGRRLGHYEAYYLILHDPPSGAAWWLRYTLLSPRPGEPVAEVWGNFFDTRSGSTLALKATHPAARAEFGRAPFRFAVGDSELTHTSARGRLRGPEGEMEWDLKWRPNEKSFRHLPPMVYHLPGPWARVLSPNLDIRIEGTLRVNRVPYEVRGAPGHQTHHWGPRHAHGWAWGHCALFREAPRVPPEPGGSRRSREDPRALFEGFSVQPMARSPRLLTFLHLRAGGRSYTFNRLADLRRTRSRYDLQGWEFSAERGGTRIEGKVAGSPERMVQLQYTDTDGSPFYCCNTQLASMRLRILEREGAEWKTRRELTAEGTAGFEVAGRERAPGVCLRV